MTIGARYAAAFMVLGVSNRNDGSVFIDDVWPDWDGTLYMEGVANSDGSLVIEYTPQEAS